MSTEHDTAIEQFKAFAQDSEKIPYSDSARRRAVQASRATGEQLDRYWESCAVTTEHLRDTID